MNFLIKVPIKIEDRLILKLTAKDKKQALKKAKEIDDNNDRGWLEWVMQGLRRYSQYDWEKAEVNKQGKKNKGKK